MAGDAVSASEEVANEAAESPARWPSASTTEPAPPASAVAPAASTAGDRGKAVGPSLHWSSAATRALVELRTRLPMLRYRVERLGPSGLAGLGALAATLGVAVFLWLPTHRATTELSARLAQGAPAAEVQAHGVDPTVIASLPTRAQVPAVLGQILVAANAAGVALDEGRYAYDPPHGGQLGRYSLEFPVTAPYPNVRDFIDRTLQSVPAAGLEKLRIKRKDIGSTTTHADIGFVVYLRGS